MSRILVLYGTTDGHTAKVAQKLAEALREHGAEADVVNAGAHALAPAPDLYAGVIVAGSLHMSSVQRGIKRWVRHHVRALSDRPNAFLLVCLAVLQPEAEVQQDLLRVRDRFFREVGWRPALMKTVAGAIPYTRYNVFKRWIMQRIARKAGEGTDTSRDYEYTDWNAVCAFAGEFLQLFPSQAPSTRHPAMA